MANVNEGLGTPAAGENVNSESGFESALAEKVGRTEELEARPDVPSTSVADGLVVAGTEPKPAPESEVELEDEDTPDDDEDAGGSSELEALLEKHGGNAIAALAEVEDRRKNAESKIGQQGNEMGQLRRELDELRGEVKTRIELAPTQTAPLPSVSADDLEEMIAEHGGMNTALWAVNNRPDLYDKVHKIWRVEEPDEASDFRLDYKLHVQKQELEKATATAAGQPDEWVASQKQQALINQALSAVQAESPEDWPLIADHMLAALEQVPQRVAAMVVSDDADERLDAVRIVADKARIISGAHLSAEGKKKTNELALERKKSATVASGSMRPVTPPGSENGEMTSEERQAAFKKALMETETTSVTEGLTYAKA